MTEQELEIIEVAGVKQGLYDHFSKAKRLLLSELRRPTAEIIGSRKTSHKISQLANELDVVSERFVKKGKELNEKKIALREKS